MNSIFKTILFYGLIASLCVSGIISCTPQGDAKMVDNYASIDDLIKDTPIIVMGTVESNNEEIVYGDVTFGLTKFKVETTYRGKVSDTINILQTKMNDDPFIHKGDKMILFLVRYEGPVTSDAYRFKGLYQGQYKIEGSKITKNSANSLSGDSVLENIDTLIAKINQVGYTPTQHGGSSVK